MDGIVSQRRGTNLQGQSHRETGTFIMAKILPTLDKLDPTEAWQPWQPSPADPWGRKWAAHLYRRAGFGPSRSDLLDAERLGYEGTLNLLLNGKSQNEDVQETLNDVAPIALVHEERG